MRNTFKSPFRTPSRLLYLSFLLSGAAALIAEFVWLRMLTSSLGDGAASLNAILIAFMGGLSAGAAMARSVIRRQIKPLYAYLAIEFVLAACLAVSPQVIGFTNQMVISILPGISSEGLRYAFRLVSAALAVGPATMFMGMTTPLLIASVVQNPEGTASGAGLFYGVNTLGGMCGALIAGCYLFLEFGVTPTLYMAAGLNLMAALISLPACWKIRKEPADTEAAGRRNAGGLHKMSRFVLLAFAGGFCGMALEIIFARFLLFTVGGSYFSHTIILSGFLAGIFVGSLILGLLSSRREISPKNVPVLFSLFGFASLVSALLYPEIASFIQSFFVGEHSLSLSPLTVKFLAAFLVTLLPAAVSGMILPLLAGLASQAQHEIGTPVSRIFAWNTVGAVAGVGITGSLVIRILGVRSAAFAISLLLFIPAVFAYGKTGMARLSGLLGVTACLLLLLFGPGYPLVIHSPNYEKHGRPPVMFYREDENASVSVLDLQKDEARSLMINGLESAVDYAVQDRDDMGWLADISLLAHPSPRSVFVAGLGAGRTAGTAGLYPNLNVTVVEISPSVIRALPLFDPFDFNASRNPSVRVIQGDARNYLLMTPGTFDVINSDVFVSALTGTCYLYNKEFFQVCLNRLTKDGRMVIQEGMLDRPMSRIVAKTFCAAAPYVKAVFVPALQCYFLIGGKQEIDLNHRIPEEWTKNRLLMDRFRFLGVSMDKGMSEFPSLSRQQLMDRLRSVPISTDDHPALDFMVRPTRDDPFAW